MDKVMFIMDKTSGIGGAQISTNILINELSKQGYKISLAVPEKVDKLMIDDTRFRIIELKSFSTVSINISKLGKILIDIFILLKLINLETPDIIYAQSPLIGLSIGLLKKYRLISKKVKLVYISREMIDSYTNKLKKAYKMFVTRIYDFVVCTTNKNAELWQILDNQTNLFLLPNTAGYLYEEYNECSRKEIRSKHNLSDKSVVIGFCGRMAPEKNWPMVYEICRELLLHTNAYIALAIGVENIKEERDAKNMIRALKKISPERIIDNINLDQVKMSEFYYLIDIFILCSHTEAFGRTAIEAMSRKCAVVASNVGGLPEVVLKKENLLENSLETFTSKINEYLLDNNILESDKKLFYKIFKEKFSISTHKSLLLSLCKKL